MAGKGKLEGPLYTNPGSQGGLGGEPVKKLPALNPPDPLGLVKAK